MQSGKMLSPQRNNYGIAQGDMYQMYAYQKKYDAKKVILIYPYHPSMEYCRNNLSFCARDQACVEGFLFDLTDTAASLERLGKAVDREPEHV